MRRLTLITTLAACFAFSHAASSSALACTGHRQCVKTVCWYMVAPGDGGEGFPVCVEVSSEGEGTGEVSDLTATTKQIQWEETSFRGFHPLTGPVHIDLDTERTSLGRVQSHDPTGLKFFPADAEIRFFFRVQVPNFGWDLTHDDPIVVASPGIQAIPPVGAVFKLQEPVQFRSQNGSDTVLELRTARILFEPNQATAGAMGGFPADPFLFAGLLLPLPWLLWRRREYQRLEFDSEAALHGLFACLAVAGSGVMALLWTYHAVPFEWGWKLAIFSLAVALLTYARCLQGTTAEWVRSRVD
ncbi:MAG: hypothetical protein AAF481_03745 [Acidobacteriota bacterium]